MNRDKKFLIWLGLIFIVGVGLQFFFQCGRSISSPLLPNNVIPEVISGVTIRDMQIAATESVVKAVDEALGFSDYRYREYRSDGIEFSVYLAYWQSRKRHFMDLGTHAPDNCWVSSGWKMDPKLPKRPFSVQIASSSGSGGTQLSALNSQPSATTWPAEDRVFHAAGNTIYVAYWHLLDGKPLDYTRYGTGKTVGYLMDNLNHYWRGTAEQYFLRISSNRPLDELERDPAFQVVLASLAKHLPLSATSD